MLNERRVVILVMVILGLIFVGQSAIADRVSIVGSRVRTQVVYNHRSGDKLTSEKLDANKLDDWIERGASSVTDSPKFKGGIRLATWSSLDKDEYDFGLASAIYSFQIPHRAGSIKIKIHYDGESGKYSSDDDAAGRIWIKSKDTEDRYDRRYSDRGDSDQPLYGDTFILPRKKDDVEIKISSRDHVIDGNMELHVIAEGGQRIDIDYIKVESYTYLPEVRIVAREYKGYRPRLWYHQTYSYFYTGPVYYSSGDHYVTYIYPRNYNVVETRVRYGNYLREYHVRHPQVHLFWSGKLNFPKFSIGIGSHGIMVNKWTPKHEKTMEVYEKHGKGKDWDKRDDDRDNKRGRNRGR